MRTTDLKHSFPHLHVLTHPLAAYKLALMRDPLCSTNKFRALAKELGMFLTYEATRDLVFELKGISSDGGTKTNRKYVIISVLRSGLPMAEGASEIIPVARIGHFGFYRDEKTRKVERHLIALPTPENAHYIIIDSVIGTGDTATLAGHILRDIGTPTKDITFCALLAAREGIGQLSAAHRGSRIFIACVEDGLDENGCVRPGFGSDENDKMFGIR